MRSRLPRHRGLLAVPIVLISTTGVLLGTVGLPLGTSAACGCEASGSIFSITASPRNIEGINSEATFTVRNQTSERQDVERLPAMNELEEFDWNPASVEECEKDYEPDDSCSWNVKYRANVEARVTFDVEADHRLIGFTSVTGKP
jgi:hypothetical protein